MSHKTGRTFVIYLDNNSTTQPLPEVTQIIVKELEFNWGNPSASYDFGSKSKMTIEDARQSISHLINSRSTEIFFTSCATESTTQAFLSATSIAPSKKHIITTKVEHSSVLENCNFYEKKGYTVTYLDVDREGMLKLDQLQKAITIETCLVSIMWANNETGVIFPIKEISHICTQKDIPFHCDAVQAIGKIPIDLMNFAIDYLSISAHKIHGPKGIGALYVKHGSPLTPLIIGGGQEGKMRGGTYNTAYIAGFGVAAKLAKINFVNYQNATKRIRDKFEEELRIAMPSVYFNGQESPRITNTSNFGFPGIDSDVLMNVLANKEIYVATGSACTSDAISPSHVITEMKSYNQANEAIRVSFTSTTYTISNIIDAIEAAYTLLS